MDNAPRQCRSHTYLDALTLIRTEVAPLDALPHIRNDLGPAPAIHKYDESQPRKAFLVLSIQLCQLGPAISRIQLGLFC